MELRHGGSSFGISKIIDVKIDEGGRQLYKVKWEPTWVPSENLATCQHLIDEFWSFVNKVKKTEVAIGIHKRKMLDPAPNDSIKKLSMDNKADVLSLIARTNTTTVGNGMSIPNEQRIFTPSNRLLPTGNMPISSNDLQTNLDGVVSTHGNNNQNVSRYPLTRKLDVQSPGQKLDFYGQLNVNSSDQKGVMIASGNKTPTSRIKTEPKDITNVLSPSTPGKTTNTSTLKYLQNFSNPYVKIVLVCIICNKEQSMKSGTNWKQHYLTHASHDEKPHKCHICQKAFVQAPKLTTHLKTHEKKITPKIEEYTMD